MHPVAEFRKDVEELRRENAELRARLDALAPLAPQAGAEPIDPRLVGHGPHAFIDECNIARHGNGKVIVPKLTTEDHAARQAREKAEGDAAHDEIWAKRREGLPPGLWRCPSGVIRNAAGKVASRADYENAAADAVRRGQAAEQRAYKQSIGLPVRPPPDDPAD